MDNGPMLLDDFPFPVRHILAHNRGGVGMGLGVPAARSEGPSGPSGP
jgi:hypothetical protein